MLVVQVESYGSPEPHGVEKKREITSGEEKKEENLSRYFNIITR